MTQIKTELHLKEELVQSAESWWMDAAAKTIITAGLQDVFLAHLQQIAAKNGHKDLLGELLKEARLPKRG